MLRSFSPLCVFLLSLGFASPLVAQSSAPATPVFNWTTLAGRASLGHEDGPAAAARFNHPHGLARDQAGNVYVADRENHTIRKIAPNGAVSTLAGSPGQPGSADGTGAAARFDTPRGLAVDGSGNVYVADMMNSTVRKITPAGVVTTLAGQPGKNGYADGPAASALFDYIDQIGADSAGNVYVVDRGIRKISGGAVTTFYAGSTLTDPNGRAFAVEPGNSLTVTPAGLVYNVAHATPWAGPGLCIIQLDAMGTATFALPPATFGAEGAGTPMDMIGALAPDGAAGFYYFFSQQVYFGHENEIAHWDPATGVNWLRELTDRHHLDASALGITRAPSGELLYTLEEDNSVRVLGSFNAYAGTPLAHVPVDGPGASARFCDLTCLAVDASGNVWAGDNTYRRIADDIRGAAYLRKIAPDGSTTTPYATAESEPPIWAQSLAVDGSDNVFFGNILSHEVFLRFAPNGSSLMLPDSLPFYSYPASNTAANVGGVLAIAEYRGAVTKWDPITNQWSQLAGSPVAMLQPIERKDGTGNDAVFGNLIAITADRQGNFYVLDYVTAPSTCVIRKVTPAGVVTTVSRDLTVSILANAPTSLAIDSAGQFYLRNPDDTVRLLTGSGDPLVVGGSPWLEGHEDGRGAVARFGHSSALAIDKQDNLYLIDDAGAVIRKGQFLGYAPLFTAQPMGGTFAAGATVTLSVAASGTPAPTFQWYRDGVSLPGSTAATLKIASLSNATTGSYTVAATNTAGSTLSTAATVSLASSTPPPPPPTGGTGGGSGGGGAPSPWFLAALLALAAAQKFRGR